MVDFPTLSKGIDMATFGYEPIEDPGQQSPSDGGVVHSRPRYTRSVRYRYKFGFTSMSDADRLEVDTFFSGRAGSARGFNWTNPLDGVIHNVRFQQGQVPTFKWAGVGTTKLWDISNIIVEEV